MGAEVDRLELNIESHASNANQQLDAMIARLEQARRKLTGMDFSSFRSGAKEIGRMRDAAVELSRVKLPDYSKVISQLNTLSRIKLTGTGINALVNSVTRLTGVNVGAFDADALMRIADTISRIGAIPDVSNSINRLVGGLARLAGAGDKVSLTAQNFPALQNALTQLVNSVAGAQAVSEPINMFIQNISRLATAGSRISQSADGLDMLSASVTNFLHAMSAAPNISTNVLNMVQAISQLAASGGRVRTAANGIVSALNRQSQVTRAATGATGTFREIVKQTAARLTKFASSALNPINACRRLGSTVSGAFKRIGASSKHIDRARVSLKGLLKSILPLLGIRQLFNWGKRCIFLKLTEDEEVDADGARIMGDGTKIDKNGFMSIDENSQIELPFEE